MAVEMCEIEVWVKINDQGEYEVGTNDEEAKDRFEETIGDDGLKGTRFVKLTVKVPLPKPIEIVGEVTMSEEAGELKAA